MTWEGLNPPYSTIVADPPWGYEEQSAPWRASSTASRYSLMSCDEIAELPIHELAAEDAHLYLWSTLPMMATAFKIVDTWGFKAEGMLTWCKPGPGLGSGFRGNTEHLIVARRGFSYINPTCASCGGRVRGKKRCACDESTWMHGGAIVTEAPRRAFTGTADGTWYQAPRGAHSEKPALFADLIERMSPGPYVELFARAPRLGWDSWGKGYEVGSGVGLVDDRVKR